ncbi:CAP domain-containing protein [Singulisphaera acidiphila]|uniref:Uncharacterized protein with SCP/PR1 domains n=1 Tax=Singulisphaera acidiphila (strain ATCC BAA-1392 / DSM 18658 / VKM B-2454 / MOB10) TaxID=886293 RepID=L0DQW2_SINAD|nr:CAP domain-containing protein [Singulisphaera acidiphila]AGA31393.1 uncharacterized protein with SCP/PR1 domains [Singulisphaera acidiphila DSM 18658]
MPFATLLKMNTVFPLGLLALALAATQPAGAQQVTIPPATAVAPRPVTIARPATAAVASPVQAAPAPPAGDPYGFTAWLNATRASYGLPPVGYDPNLSSWASVNNGQQQSRGMGHHVMGPARRQNAAMGQYASIGAMWMNSPGHRAALLDPTIRWIGIAGLGAYWTFNAY